MGLAGSIFHAPFIRLVDGLNLVAVARTSGERDARYPDVQFVRSVDELLNIDSIRLIVVATPNDSHYTIARQCLLAGRDVVVDKPFTPTLKEAEELVKLARIQGRLLTVFQNRRWDGDFQTVRQLISSGALGTLLTFESHFDRFRPKLRASWQERPVPGMGLLYDLGPHLIDQALQLFGSPEQVFADLRKEREGTPIEDAFDLIFYYPKMRVLLRASPMTIAPGPRFWICGSNATFTKYGLDPQEQAMVRGGDPAQPGWGTEPEDWWGTLTTESETKRVPTIAGNYRAFYENVRAAMLGKAAIAVTPQQAIDVMRGIECAIESSRTGCRIAWPK